MFRRRATGGGTAPSRLLNTSVNNVARTRQQLVKTSLQGLLGASMIPTLFTASSVAEGPAGSGERHDRLCRADARPSDPRLHHRCARLALALLRQSGAGPRHPGPRPLLVEIDEPDSSIALMAIALGTLEYVLEEGARWN